MRLIRFIAPTALLVVVWAVATAIGQGIGVFENKGDGVWNLCGQCLVDAAYPNLDGDVAAAGGPSAYVAAKVPAINAVLKARYPGSTAPVTVLDQVNQAIGTYGLRLGSGGAVLWK